jgi:hypothetical protein
MSGSCTVTPGKILTPNEVWTPDKLNQGFLPTVQVDPNSIGPTELEQATADAITAATAAIALIANKNFLINGSFDFWQRGTSFATDVVSGTNQTLATADRWGVTQHLANRTIDQVPFGFGQTSVPGAPNYALRWTQTAPVGLDPSFLSQRIEDVRTLAGTKVTLSFWAFSDTPITLGLQLTQHFGTGSNSPSGDVDSGIKSVDVPVNKWTLVTYTLTLSQIFGKTLGNDPTYGDWLEVRIRVPQGRAFILYVAQAKLEAGAIATPLVQQDLATELVACMRYYEIIITQLSTDVSKLRTPLFYKVTKRAAVDPVVYAVGAGTFPGAGGITPDGFTNMGPGGAFQTINHNVLATAFLKVDAELLS